VIETYTKQYWLNDLEESGLLLESLYRKPIWDEELEFQCEKAIFLGFYSIRKLLESKLVKSCISGMNINLTSYHSRTDLIKSSHPSESWVRNYDLLNGVDSYLSLKEICNQFIHSKFYSPLVPGGLGCVGFYVCSDTTARNNTYYIKLVAVVEILLSVARESIVKLSLNVNNGSINTCNTK
jgi:hypothetical protein